MSWRPEGWIRMGSLFESGADYLLDLLKKKGAWMTPEQMKLLAPERAYPYGWIVFIPLEEGEQPPTANEPNYQDVLDFVTDYVTSGGMVSEKYTSRPDYIADTWQPLVQLLDMLEEVK